MTTEGKIKIGILGASGYVGAELIRLLLNHPQAQIVSLGTHRHGGEAIDDLFGSFRERLDLVCHDEPLGEIADHCDLVFLSLPHGVASHAVDEVVLGQSKIIDLGADFRLSSPQTYEQWYHETHGHPELLKDRIYGLTEWARDAVKNAQLIANPGCYPTATLLTLLPALTAGLLEPETIVIDAKSGVSGAGRGLSLGTHFGEIHESIKAYGFPAHRHVPEIEEGLRRYGGKEVLVSFTPHLMPMHRGILVTIVARLKQPMSAEAVWKTYEQRYGDEPFIRVLPLGKFPETRWVKGSNYVDIGIHVDSRTQRVVLVGAIDNLVKGAAGQALQNMNLMFGLPEATGLRTLPLFPG